MLNLTNCNKILKDHNYKIKNEDLKELREYLYFLANLNNTLTDENYEECNTLL